mgnify:FL=1
MKVKYIGDYYKVGLGKGNIFDAEWTEDGYLSIYVEMLEDTFLFMPEQFEILDDKN